MLPQTKKRTDSRDASSLVEVTRTLEEARDALRGYEVAALAGIVATLAEAVQNLDILFDRWHNPPGYPLDRFTDRIESSKFVVVVGTPGLLQKYETQTQDPIVASELTLINLRLTQRTKYGPQVIPLLLDGERDSAFTPLLRNVVSIDFRDEDSYFVNLLNLIWRLYELPFDNPLLDELRDSMSPQR